MPLLDTKLTQFMHGLQIGELTVITSVDIAGLSHGTRALFTEFMFRSITCQMAGQVMGDCIRIDARNIRSFKQRLTFLLGDVEYTIKLDYTRLEDHDPEYTDSSKTVQAMYGNMLAKLPGFLSDEFTARHLLNVINSLILLRSRFALGHLVLQTPARGKLMPANE